MSDKIRLTKAQWAVFENCKSKYAKINSDRENEKIKETLSTIPDEYLDVFNPNCDIFQTDIIFEGFNNGLTYEQIKTYARPDFDDSQMIEILFGFMNKLDSSQVAVYAKPEFDRNQMCEIREGFNAGLDYTQVDVYAKLEFTKRQTERIPSFQHGLGSVGFYSVGTYEKPRFKAEQMEQIRLGFEHGLTSEQINTYAIPNYNHMQMNYIRMGFENGLTAEQVNSYANLDNSCFNMSKQFRDLTKDLYPSENNNHVSTEDIKKALSSPSVWGTGSIGEISYREEFILSTCYVLYDSKNRYIGAYHPESGEIVIYDRDCSTIEEYFEKYKDVTSPAVQKLNKDEETRD